MCKQCIRSIRSWMNKQGRTYWDQIILLSHPGWFWWAWFSYSSSVLSLQYILFAACVRVGWTCCFLWNWNKFLNARIPKLGDLVNHGKQSWIRVGGSGSKRFQGLFRRRHTQLELPSCWNYWRPTEAWWSHWWRGSSGLWKSHRLPIFPKQSRRFIKG